MKRFSEMEYNRPDMEALKAVIAEATENVKNAKSAEEVRAAYFSVQEKEEQASVLTILDPLLLNSMTEKWHGFGKPMHS